MFHGGFPDFSKTQPIRDSFCGPLRPKKNQNNLDKVATVSALLRYHSQLCVHIIEKQCNKRGAISRGKVRVVSLRLDAYIAKDRFVRGSEEVPGVASLVWLPLGRQQLSVRDDHVGGRFGRLDAVRASFVLERFFRRHLDFRFGFELSVFFVAEGAEWGWRGVGVDTVVRGAVARAVALRREETLAGLARAVTHLWHRLVVHLKIYKIVINKND